MILSSQKSVLKFYCEIFLDWGVLPSSLVMRKSTVLSVPRVTVVGKISFTTDHRKRSKKIICGFCRAELGLDGPISSKPTIFRNWTSNISHLAGVVIRPTRPRSFLSRNAGLSRNPIACLRLFSEFFARRILIWRKHLWNNILVILLLSSTR